MNNQATIIRYSIPSKYDLFPFGTICKSIKTFKKDFEVYVQVSRKKDNPCWESLGIFKEDMENIIPEKVSHLISLR